ncbi:hypothetical protein QF032_006689 [Streptomyces achromogenes]|nr:hypothetical protein [Streptomyces achromogenes]
MHGSDSALLPCPRRRLGRTTASGRRREPGPASPAMRRLGKTRRTVRTARGDDRAAAPAGRRSPCSPHCPRTPIRNVRRRPTGSSRTPASPARLRGLAAVDRHTAGVADAQGVVLRTADGGATWRDVSPPGAAGLNFRDVEAFDARRAVGPGGRGGVRRERPVPGGSRCPGRLVGDRRCRTRAGAALLRPRDDLEGRRSPRRGPRARRPRPRLPRPHARPRRGRRPPPRPALPRRPRHDHGRRPHLAARGRPAARLPLRRR